MIDDMVAQLKTEQKDDDEKKEYCAEEFDKSDDKKKVLEKGVADLKTAIEDAKEGIQTTTADIAALKTSIKSLDKAVAEATEQRKEENADFTELMASNTAAKELIEFAKNRLNKFYNPKLYKAPPKRELSEADRISVNLGGTAPPTNAPGGIAGTGIGLAQAGAAPPPPPETFGAYAKKGEESPGVISMMDMMIADLDKEITETEVEEKENQAEYEAFMKESAQKRASDAKSIEDKESAKADLEATLIKAGEEKKNKMTEAMNTAKYLSEVHGDCDWLLTNFETTEQTYENRYTHDLSHKPGKLNPEGPAV
jgi:chromosome segregation ATPase